MLLAQRALGRDRKALGVARYSRIEYLLDKLEELVNRTKKHLENDIIALGAC